jgi:membrane protein YdbS with pleckstrin-like domain
MPTHGLRLQDDESVVLEFLASPFWTMGRYLFTLGLWEFWRRKHRWVITNHRIISLRGLISRHEVGIPLERIQDIHTKTSPFTGGHVALSSAGGALGISSIGPVRRQYAYDIADTLTKTQKALMSAPTRPALSAGV